MRRFQAMLVMLVAGLVCPTKRSSQGRMPAQGTWTPLTRLVLFLCAVALGGCFPERNRIRDEPSDETTQSVPNAAPRKKCTLEDPCDRVREMFADEEKRARDLVSCQVPSADKTVCSSWESFDRQMHEAMLEYFSRICRDFKGQKAANVYAFLGRPEKDEIDTCGKVAAPWRCRQWIWTWTGGGKTGGLLLLFGQLDDPGPDNEPPWRLSSCQYCTGDGCTSIPFEP